MLLSRFVIGWSKRLCDWLIYRQTWGYLVIPSSRDRFFFLFCTIFVWISIQIPEGMDSPMKHETSARCHASRSMKQSKLQMSSSLEASRLASRWHGEYMDPSRSFPKYRNHLGGYRNCFGGYRDRFFTYGDRKLRLLTRSKSAYRDYFRAYHYLFFGSMKGLAFHTRHHHADNDLTEVCAKHEHDTSKACMRSNEIALVAVDIELSKAMLIHYTAMSNVCLHHNQTFYQSLTAVNGEKTHQWTVCGTWLSALCLY